MACIFILENGEELTFDNRNQAIEFFTENPEYVSQLVQKQALNYNGAQLSSNNKDLGKVISQGEAVDLFKKLLPGAEVKDLVFLSSLSDKGRYYNGVVELASTGTINENVLRHEVFHKIFNEYLNSQERENYLNYTKEIFGDSTNQIAEEMMARDFQTYRNSPESLPLRIARIFKNILRFLRLVQSTPQDKLESLYRAINKGKYKNTAEVRFKSTTVKNYSGIIEDFGSTQAYKKASNTLDVDIYNRSKIEDRYKLSTSNMPTVLSNTLGKKDAIKFLPDFYKQRILQLESEYQLASDEAKVGISETIENLNLILANYRKLAQELYPQEYSSVKESLQTILGETKAIKEEDSEHTQGVISNMEEDERFYEEVKNHEEVKSIPENVEDPAATEDSLHITDGFNREDSGNVFANEIGDNNAKDNETDVNDDVKWFLSHIPNEEGGFYDFRSTFPAATEIVQKLELSGSLKNQNPKDFTNGRVLNTAVAEEIKKLFEYIDPSIAAKGNPNYTFLDGTFAYYAGTKEQKGISKELSSSRKPLHMEGNWKTLRGYMKQIEFIRPKDNISTIGNYLKSVAEETGESYQDIYNAYMQQESKQILAGIAQSIGSFRHRKLFNIIEGQDEDSSFVRLKENIPIDASAHYKSTIVNSLFDNMFPRENGVTSQGLPPILDSKILNHFTSGNAPIEDFIAYTGFKKGFISTITDPKTGKLLPEASYFRNLSVVFKDTLTTFKAQIEALGENDEEKEREIINDTLLSLNGDTAINKLAETLAGLRGEFTASSVIDAEGKQKYLYVNSSNAYDTLEALQQPEIGVKTSKDLKSTKYSDNKYDYLTEETEEVTDTEGNTKTVKTFYSFNPFVKDMKNHKIYNVLDFDGTAHTAYKGFTEYTKEKESDYIVRTFVGGFLNSLATKSDPRIVQFLYTNSNRPTPLAVETNLRSEKQIDSDIEDGLNQLVNKLDLTHLEDTIDSYNRNPFLNASSFERGIQNALNSRSTGKKLLEEYKASTKKTSVVAAIKKDIISKDLDYIKSIIVDNKISTEDNLNKAIRKLQELNPDLKFTNTIADQISFVNGQLSFRYPPETDAVLEQFILNNYLNNYFINQIIIGDSTIYGDANGVVKRMSIATAPGQLGFSNELNGVPREVDVLVAEDDAQEVLDELFKDTQVEGTLYDATDAQMWFTDDFDNILKNMFGRKYGLSLVNKPVYHKTDSQGITRTIKTSGLNLGMNEALHLGTNVNLRELNEVLKSHGVMAIIPKSANKSGSPTSKLSLETRNWTPEEFATLSPEAQKYLTDLGISTINYETMTKAKKLPFEGELLRFRNTLKTGKFNIQLKTEENKDNWNASKFKLDTRYLRMQLNPSHDLEATSSNWSQMQSFAGILVKPETEKFVNQFYEDYANLGRLYRKELIRDLQTNNQFDSVKITSMVKDTLQSKGSERLADVISYIGLDHPSIYKKVQTQLSSIIEKKGLNTKFNGGKFTLISSHLFFNPTTRERLKFIEDPKTGKRYAEILAPAELFDKSVQAKIKKGEDVYLHSEQVGFRIPSTELNSAVALKVVGFHTSRNNSLVLPQEIVPLHGSDYDVDALFLMLKEKTKVAVNYSKSAVIEGKVHTSYLQIPKGQPIGYGNDGVFINNFDNVIQSQKQQEVSREEYAQIQAVFNKSTAEKELKDPYFENKFAGYNKSAARKNKKLDNLLKAYYKNRIVNNMMNIIQKESTRMSNPISMDILKDPNTEGSMSQYLREQKALPKSDSVDLSSFVDNHTSYKSNMAGSALTGIMANNTKAIAVLSRAGTHNFGISYLGKDLNNFAGTQEVFNNLSALVNAAIDNVKEQILFKGNISTDTGNVVATMVALGLPMNEIFGLILQPSIRLLSNYGNTDRGKQILRDLIAEELQSLKIQTTDFTQEDLDSIINGHPMGETVSFKGMSRKDLEIQELALSKFEEFANIGEILRSMSSALSILRAAPSSYAEVKSNLNTWQNIFNQGGLELTPVYNKNNGTVVDLRVTPIVTEEEISYPLNLKDFFKKSPYIKEAIITIYNHKVITEQSVLFNPALNDFVESFNNQSGKDIGVGVPVIFSLDNKQENHEEAIRDYILKLAMAQTFVEEVKDEVLEKSSIKGKVLLKKSAAFKEKFSREVRRVKSLYNQLSASQQNNKFMTYLGAEQSTKNNSLFVAFRQPSNLQESDVLQIQEDFKEISNLPLKGMSQEELERFKLDLIKYSSLATGMSFGLTGYSQFIPGSYLVDNAEKFKKFLRYISANLNQLDFPLVMMIAKANPKAFKKIYKSNLNTKGNPNGDIKYDLNVKKGLDSGVITYKEVPYIFLAEKAGELLYRKLFPDVSVADFDLNVQEYLANPLNLESAFDPRVRELFTTSITDLGATINKVNISNYKQGDVVTLTNSSDYFRENSVRAYISDIQKVGESYDINLTYNKGVEALNTTEKLENFKKLFKVC